MDSNQSRDIKPLLYNPSYEEPEKNEQETVDELLKELAKVRETTYKDSGHAMRSVHVKSHGLLHGKLTVPDNLPDNLAQGIFKTPGTYDLLMRFSTAPGDMLPDKVSTPRGCAIKIIGIDGTRLPGTENDTTQDFVMVNGGSTFQVSNLKAFVASIKLLAATTDKFPGAKVAISNVLQGVEKVIEKFGGSSPTLKNLGGEPENNLLGETYFTQLPLRHGKYMAKISMKPFSPALKELTGKPLNDHDNPTALRDAIVGFFKNHEGEWDLQVQLSTDIEKMPVEEATKEWPEEISPYVTVGKITLPAQAGWSEELSVLMDDQMSFSPWHGTEDHRPIGSLMRVRKIAYEQSAKFREKYNGKKMMEPKSVSEMPFVK